MKRLFNLLVLACVLSQGLAQAQERSNVDGPAILGNQELPKVLYIVPWKKPLPGDLAGRPGGGVLDEALAPIDRDVFRRQISYDAQLAPRSDAAAPAAR